MRECDASFSYVVLPQQIDPAGRSKHNALLAFIMPHIYVLLLTRHSPCCYQHLRRYKGVLETLYILLSLVGMAPH